MSDPFSETPWWDGDYVWRPAEASAPEPLPESPPLEPLPALVPCWRCGKDVESGTATCPYCRARLRFAAGTEETRPGRSVRIKAAASGVLPLLGFYGVLLLVSLVHGLLVFSAVRKGALAADEMLTLALVVEAIDTVLVVAALFCVRSPAPPLQTSPGVRIGAWASAAPLLLILLGLNLAYHLLLRELLGLPAGDLGLDRDSLTPLVLLIFCVQPAIVEELFFRYLALGALRRHMGLHGAVLVSSVMFGMAHIGQPFAIPFLIVLGMAFAYVRVASRSLLLPMLMHFAHNLAVLLLAQAL